MKLRIERPQIEASRRCMDVPCLAAVHATIVMTDWSRQPANGLARYVCGGRLHSHPVATRSSPRAPGYRTDRPTDQPTGQMEQIPSTLMDAFCGNFVIKRKVLRSHISNAGLRASVKRLQTIKLIWLINRL